MEVSIFTDLKFESIECCSCGVVFAVPRQYYNRLRENHTWFHCPNGHEQHFTAKSEAEKLREELKRKEQELADTAIQKRLLENKVTEANKKLDRIQNGVCPCCNRSFKNLKRHMATKHPSHTQTKK